METTFLDDMSMRKRKRILMSLVLIPFWWYLSYQQKSN